jgi:hypothetical protein
VGCVCGFLDHFSSVLCPLALGGTRILSVYNKLRKLPIFSIQA